jgi:hypothetical protein
MVVPVYGEFRAFWFICNIVKAGGAGGWLALSSIGFLRDGRRQRHKDLLR